MHGHYWEGFSSENIFCFCMIKFYIDMQSSDKAKYKGKGKSTDLFPLFEISTKQDSSADKYFQYMHFFYL